VNTNLGSLAPGASQAIPAIYVITQADIDSNATLEPNNVIAGKIDNTATADSDQTTPVSDSEQVPLTQNPVLAIDKVVTGVDTAGNGVLDQAGDIINYNLVVTNNGNQTLTNVIVTDPLTGVNTNLGSLAPGASQAIPAIYVITQADIDSNATLEPNNVIAGKIDNTATADSDQTTPVSDSEQVPLTQNPVLAIDKVVTGVDTAGNGVLDQAGDIINYNLVVTNNGNVTLTNVIVTDPLTGVNTNLGSLAPGASQAIPAIYVITQADIDSNATLEPNNVIAGKIDNTATADSDQTTPVSDSEQVPLTQNPVLAIDKVVTGVDTAGNGVLDQAGDIINYNLVVTNNGNQTLTNVIVTDPLTGVNTNLGSLAPGASQAIPAIYVITQADIDSNATLEPDNVIAGKIDNTATADSDQTTPVSDSEQVPLTQNPVLAIDKVVTGVDTAGNGVLDQAGDIINYNLVVTNNGNQTLTNVIVTDPLTGVNTNLGSLAPGASQAIPAIYVITQADIDSNATLEPNNVIAGKIDNTATADSDQTTPVSDSEQVPLTQNPVLAIDKVVTGVDTAGNGVLDQAGDIINYNLVVTNNGNQTLTNVIVTDPLTGVNTNLGSLAPGASQAIPAIYVITQADIDSNATLEPNNVIAGKIDNTATADSDQTTPVSDSEQVPLTQNPVLAIDKVVTGVDTAGNGVLDQAGDIINYNLVVTNNGNQTLTNVIVTDPLTGVNTNLGSLAPGASQAIPAIYVITQADIDSNATLEPNNVIAGKIDNTATADSDQTTPVSDSEQVPLTQNPVLAIDKVVTGVDTAGNGVLDQAGDIINYNLVVTNNGNQTLTNVIVTDPLTGVNTNLGSLAPGASQAIPAIYVITQADIDSNATLEPNNVIAGKIDNTATADSDQTTPVSDSESVPLVQQGSIGDFVWEDLNYNGKQDANEPGIAGVTVNLLDTNGNVVKTTQTGSGNDLGKYLFGNVAPGDYSIQVVKPSNGYFFTKPNVPGDDALDSDVGDTGLTAIFNLSAGENDLSVDAGLYRKANLGDRVWLDRDNDGIQDLNEKGVDKVIVKLLDSSGAQIGMTTTDASGKYLFSNLDPGSYTIEFDKSLAQTGAISVAKYPWGKQDQGGDDGLDSDVFGSGFKATVSVTLESGENDLTQDAAITPIVIDLNGDGIKTIARADSQGTFDLLGTGSGINSGWLSGDDGFLVVDRNGNGSIDDISEMFGGSSKGDGFAKLASFDSNGDGVVDAKDADFAGLKIWRDVNGNHQTDNGELMSLADAGLVGLSISYSELPFLDAKGNLHLERGSATRADGSVVDMTDVYFNISASDAAAAGVQAPNLAELMGSDNSFDSLMTDVEVVAGQEPFHTAMREAADSTNGGYAADSSGMNSMEVQLVGQAEASFSGVF
jgi:uncharacterized repeat protein (TIGR01451 family)